MNEILKQCMLFKHLSTREIDEIFTGIFYQIREYEIGTIIAYQDEKVEHLIILINGVVRGEMNDFSGKTIVIEEMEAPKILAPAFVFGENSIFPVNIVSQMKSRVLKIPKTEFVKMMQKNQVLMVNFMNQISDRTQFLSQKLKFLSFQSIKGKLAYYISNLAHREHTKQIVLPISQAKLAELFGVARPSLSRAIREMHNDKIIHSNGKYIEILEENCLNKLMR